MKKYEKLGAFYLGRLQDEGRSRFLYDAKDLTTHGLVVGMTGSGKTGLSIVLLEEAAIDGVPALVIDPKGDMGNLLLRFPALEPEDFRPWLDASEATRRGMTLDQLASETASTWAEGIESWDQSKSRLRALEKAADVRIYTPGSNSGRPIALLRAFDAPSEGVRADQDALRERVLNAVSGLLGLIGVEADPVTSREHILLSNILERAWSDGEDRTLESILKEIHVPPFDELGVLDLESFFPAKDRFALVAKLNNLLASPAFAAWREGEPLEIPRLLYDEDGRPRHSVLSIAHLSDEERMFFVTLFLNEVIAWMRSQAGTGSLRAILYMDEIFGYFPPVKAPPSKAPMLTLLKQARAYGVGVLLATQNPVDLDYKGLSNIGTWFLGRLQTARDRDRLMEGLTSASPPSRNDAFDRKKTEELLASLDKRVFLCRNIHEDAPVVFQTRWALSYLRGPLTLQQIKELTGPVERPATKPSARPPRDAVSERPQAPDGVEECFLDPVHGRDPAVYEPHVLASAKLHYVRAGYSVDHWEELCFLVPLDEPRPEWSLGTRIDRVTTRDVPSPDVAFSELPASARDEKSYAKWQKSFLAYLHRERPLALYRCKKLKLYSEPHETEGAFRSRVAHALHEKRDEAVETLRKHYAPKLAQLQERVRKAELRVERESSQYTAQRTQTAISIGETLLGALFGRKLGSRANVGRASRSARAASRASREREDVAHAKKELSAQKRKLAELEKELEQKTRAIREDVRVDRYEVEALTLRFRKSDTSVERFALAWA